MKIKFNRCLIILILSVVSIVDLSADNFRVSGFVKDARTNEALIGAVVREADTNKGISTDTRGYFNLVMGEKQSLTISYVGYQTQTIALRQAKDTLMLVALEEGQLLNEVVVSAPSVGHFDATRLSAEKLMLTPSLGAKPDVLKTLQLLPGVQSHSEGLSMILVRGGDPGQNQYLLDKVPLTYVNHLEGFMSVFNPDMIHNVDFYKGSFPAAYGGKLSSIVDITQREGDISKHQGSFSIGLTDVSLAFEGPLFKSKGSYMITARKTLTELLMMGFTAIDDGNNALAGYGFHDVNAKFTWKADDKNNLQLNLYTGDDYLNYWLKWWDNFDVSKNERNHIKQQWGNWLVSTKWKRAFEQGWYMENILSYSRYRNVNQLDYKDLKAKTELTQIDRSSVQDLSLRSSLTYSPTSYWNAELGGQASYLKYEPGYIYRSDATVPTRREIYRSVETALYLENKVNLSSRVLLQPSIRLNGYFNDNYRFMYLEPRLNLQVKVTENQYFNLNYMTVSQNSHLVFTQGSVLKKEIWMPATRNIPSQTARQISLGWNSTYREGMFGADINIYHKTMHNLATLQEGYENMMNITDIENKMATDGKGIAYGAELSVSKYKGQWTGSVSYAYSKSTRQFERINEGQVYDYEYNRPHNLILNIGRQLSKAWVLSVVWVCQSGFLFTPAIGKQYATDFDNPDDTYIALIYGERNSVCMPAYHRLDVGLNYTTQSKKGNKAVWTFSVYNLYNRKNAYNFYYDNDNDFDNWTDYSKPLQLYQSSFFPMIPSVSYKVYFDYSKKEKKEKTAKPRRNWLYF
ncbi:MAG: TonB-dependent receptor [Paludibacteraceae bacterium]